MKLSVIVPSLTGDVPSSLLKQTAGRSDVEVVLVVGVRPVGKARNEGLRRATGEYIAWVDADDEVSEEWLKEIQTALENAPDAIVFDMKAVGWPCMTCCVYGQTSSDDIVRDLYANRRLQGHLFRTVTRRKLWQNVAFDETLCAMEDFLALPKALLGAASVMYLPKQLYLYVRNEGSAISSVSMRRIEDGIRAAICRWQEAPEGYRDVALIGSLRLIYDTLQTLKVDPTFRRAEGRPNVLEGTRFVRRHVFDVPMCGQERLRFLCAGLNFWLLQRLIHWYHFERRHS